MRKLRVFNAKKAVKAFYSGKKRKLTKFVGADKVTSSRTEIDIALELSKQFMSNSK